MDRWDGGVMAGTLKRRYLNDTIWSPMKSSHHRYERDTSICKCVTHVDKQNTIFIYLFPNKHMSVVCVYL